MQRVVIFGNSGSGKSTLSQNIAEMYNLKVLDLDILAWTNENPPKRKPLNESQVQLSKFIENNNSWVIEGCYADLLELVLPLADDVIFLNPGTEVCLNNCKTRPWEPHKYETPEEQNNNLDMLLDWVKQYSIREDEFSLHAHQRLYKSFSGNKREFNQMLTKV